MATSSKEDWLNGPSDLAEAVVEDAPRKGLSVKVRGLPAQFSNEANSKALKYVQDDRGGQAVTIDKAEMEIIQFSNGCVDPIFSIDEARDIAKKYGPAFFKVIAEIDRLSGVDKDAIEEASARFPDGVEVEGHVREAGDGGVAGDSVGPAVPSGAGA